MRSSPRLGPHHRQSLPFYLESQLYVSPDSRSTGQDGHREETKECTPSLTCSSESQEVPNAIVLLGWLSQAPCLSQNQPGPGLGSGCLVQSTLDCTPEPTACTLLGGHTEEPHPAQLASALCKGPRPSLPAHPGSSAPTAPSSDLRAHPAKVTHLAANPHGLVVGPQLFVFSISIKLPPRLMSYLLLDYKNSCHHSHGIEYRIRSKNC